jgi:hypothetical protein
MGSTLLVAKRMFPGGGKHLFLVVQNLPVSLLNKWRSREAKELKRVSKVEAE